MQTCKTCQHWGGMPNGGYVEGWTAVCHGEGRDEESRSAFHLDAYADMAHLMTGPDFGCLAHEPATEAVQEDDGA